MKIEKVKDNKSSFAFASFKLTDRPKDRSGKTSFEECLEGK